MLYLSIAIRFQITISVRPITVSFLLETRFTMSNSVRIQFLVLMDGRWLSLYNVFHFGLKEGTIISCLSLPTLMMAKPMVLQSYSHFLQSTSWIRSSQWSTTSNLSSIQPVFSSSEWRTRKLAAKPWLDWDSGIDRKPMILDPLLTNIKARSLQRENDPFHETPVLPCILDGMWK